MKHRGKLPADGRRREGGKITEEERGEILIDESKLSDIFPSLFQVLGLDHPYQPMVLPGRGGPEIKLFTSPWFLCGIKRTWT